MTVKDHAVNCTTGSVGPPDDFLSSRLRELRATVQKIADEEIAPRADQIDQECMWPSHSLCVLGQEGILGLHVPRRCGGHEQGLLALTAMTETIARCCPSTAMCFGMHCVGTAVIAAKATPYQEDRYLRPIAEGEHITTLALSETGTGSHFYMPQTALNRDGNSFVVNGTKQFITNGGHADSYVISTLASEENLEAGEFTCLMVDRDTPGTTWLEPWRGFGMRGNSSRGLRLEDVRIPVENLLGQEGEQIWYAFEVVAPYFLTAMAGTYLGIAQKAFDITVDHVKSRSYSHSGESLSDYSSIQEKVAMMWIKVQQARSFIYRGADALDKGHADALNWILCGKVVAAEAAVSLTNEAMTICGGIAYRENAELSRLLRDARASHVMSPTTDLLKLWAGRSLLGVPLL